MKSLPSHNFYVLGTRKTPTCCKVPTRFWRSLCLHLFSPFHTCPEVFQFISTLLQKRGDCAFSRCVTRASSAAGSLSWLFFCANKHNLRIFARSFSPTNDLLNVKPGLDTIVLSSVADTTPGCLTTAKDENISHLRVICVSPFVSPLSTHLLALALYVILTRDWCERNRKTNSSI